MTTDLHDRLASLRIEMPEAIAERHLAAIGEELASPAGAWVPTGRHRRRRLVATVVAGALLLLPAAAFAAEEAVPGDVLYPVKRTTEWVRSFADPEIRAEHRIAELETVIERGAAREEMEQRLSDAEAAVRETPVTPELTVRLRRVQARMAAERRMAERRMAEELETPPLEERPRLGDTSLPTATTTTEPGATTTTTSEGTGPTDWTQPSDTNSGPRMEGEERNRGDE